MKKLRLYIPIYGEYVTFLVSDTKDILIDYIKENQPKGYSLDWIEGVNKTYEDETKRSARFLSYEGDNEYYIIIRRKPKDMQDIAIVNHEILHITNKILFNRGLKLMPETEEAYTYLQQYMLEEFCKSFKLKLK